MPDLPARTDSTGWWLRAVGSVSVLYRATLAQMGVTSQPPRTPGAAYGTIAARPMAESDLQQIAQSPVVYAAAMRRARSFGNYPFIVLADEETLEPRKTPWVAELLRMLQNPDPDDLSSRGDPQWLAPVEPGEGLIAQLVVDLLMEGVAYVIPTAGQKNRIAGLTRAHPKTMKLTQGGQSWTHTVDGRQTMYPRRAVFCLRNPSWEASGQGELGTGAAQVLAPLVAAERAALIKSAMIIDQGGADVVVSAKTPQAAMFLSNPQNREAVKKDVESALSMRDGGRVIVLGGDLEAKDLGLKPGDIQAPELMVAAKSAELMAIGCTPVAIGGESANYASAALQYRVQAELDEALASVFEAYMLRPLAQHYARIAGKGIVDASLVTCRMDLSSHPGYAFARTEALDRMQKLIAMGWTAEQASDIEQLGLPKPKGEPKAATAPVAVTPNPEPPPAGDTSTPRSAPVIWLPKAREPASPEEDIPARGVGTGRPAAAGV